MESAKSIPIQIPDGLADSLRKPIRDTLTEVLDDPVLNRTFGGKDGRLSSAQAGLASAVTVKMQDRLVQHIELSHDRELALLVGFWRLYRTPVFQKSSAAGSAATSSDGSQASSKGGGLFTWGNLIGGAGIVLVALSFFYTRLTWSYEQQWKSAEADAVVLRQRLQSEQSANEALQFELGKAQARAEASEKTVANLTSNATEQQKQLLQAIADFSQQKGELAKQVAASTGEKKFQSLYDGAQKDLKDLRSKNAELLQRAITAEERLKAKS